MIDVVQKYKEELNLLSRGDVGSSGCYLFPEKSDGKPLLYADDQDLARITEHCWYALRFENSLNPRFFRFAGKIVRIEQDDTGIPIAQPLNPERLRQVLSDIAVWRSKRNGSEAKPPIDVVKNVLATPDYPLPVLTRIVEAPVLGVNGELQTAPGFHDASGVYHVPAKNLEIPTVPADPTAEDIRKARDSILSLLTDFPFEGEADLAHAVALFLLPFARDLIRGPTPNHLCEAPEAGSGKGLLTEVLLYPALGEIISVISETRNDEEIRKRITAVLLSGSPAIVLDNITRPIDSGTLSAAITAKNWGDRLLSTNSMVNLPVRCVWAMTANNPVLSIEVARRTIRIRLNPKVEQPWRREGFIHPNLRGWVCENRGLLVWSALVLLRGWIAADRPSPKVKPLGSFENWTHVIGGTLEVAGIPGFLGNLCELYSIVDSEGSILRTFVAAWWEKHSTAEVGVADLFNVAKGIEGFDFGRGESERGQRTSFGRTLMKQRDRVIGDWRIIYLGTRRQAGRWKLEPTRIFTNTGELYEQM